VAAPASALRIGLVGDHDEAITAHRAIPWALSLASGVLGLTLRSTWLHTDMLIDARAVDGFDALWCVPGSPYRSMDGALRAIRFAREEGRPLPGHLRRLPACSDRVRTPRAALVRRRA
jgi:CTP synthase (UTP-ammonia lyase)